VVPAPLVEMPDGWRAHIRVALSTACKSYAQPDDTGIHRVLLNLVNGAYLNVLELDREKKLATWFAAGPNLTSSNIQWVSD